MVVVYRRKDGRWEASAPSFGPGGTRRRVSVYATIRREGLTLLAEKTATSRKGLPTRAAPASPPSPTT